MQKVLFISRKWPPAIGGMEAYSYELASELKNRVKLDLCVLPGRRDGRPPSLWALASFGLRTTVALLTRKVKYDVVHGSDLAIWPLVWLTTLRRNKTKPILSAHGTDIALAYRRGAHARLYSMYLKLGMWLLPSVDVIANSRATERLCTEIGLSSVCVIPLAARLSEAICQSPKPFILFAGRLLPMKGCAWFIRKVLPRLKRELKFVVAGTIWNADEELALNDPRVDFRGPVTKEYLSHLCLTATAIVIPNLDIGINGFEGFGLFATEGAAAGGIVLASRLHGVTQAVQDGITGFLLPAGNADAWAVKIEEVAHWSFNQRCMFINRAHAAIKTHYSWRRVADETIDAYCSPRQRN